MCANQKMVEASASASASTSAPTTTNHDDNHLLQEVEADCLQLVTCDADGCTRKNPIYACDHCQCVRYCSRECRANHWQSRHRLEDCPSMDDMRAGFASLGNNNSSESSRTTAAALEPDPETIRQVLEAQPSCGICLSQEMSHPIVLHTCHHAFCFACLKQWNEHEPCLTMMATASPASTHQHNRSSSTCPLCRQPFPKLVDTIFTNALLHLTVAGTDGVTKQERDKRLALARTEIEKVQTKSRHHLTDHERVHANMILGETAIMSQDYDMALGLFRESAQRVQVMVERQERIQALLSRFRLLLFANPSTNMHECERIRKEAQKLMQQGGKAQPTDHVVVLLKIGKVQCLLGNWYDALSTYQDICSRYPNEPTAASTTTTTTRTPAGALTEWQQREMFASLAQVAYHLGHLDRAIYCGEASVAMNRYYAWSHKYLALAHQAAGNFDRARQVAAEAVTHETPWDSGHRAQVRRWYQETFGTANDKE